MAVRDLVSTHEIKIIPKSPKNLTSEIIWDAVAQAEQRIAPLWSLRHFVAVNPYLGLSNQTFERAAHTLARQAGARMTAQRVFYAQAIKNGRITDADLEAALRETNPLNAALTTAAQLKSFADTTSAIQYETVPTVTDVVKAATGQDWQPVMVEAISSWAGTYFDEGQSYWHSPFKDLSPYAAWRAEAAVDRTPEVRGISAFRQTIAAFPESATETIETALGILNVPVSGLVAYLHRLLLTIHGWASYARWRRWEAELRDNHDDTLTELLAIRLAWETALLKAFEAQGIRKVWDTKKQELSRLKLSQREQIALEGDLLLQKAFEKAYQRQLIAKLKTPKQPQSTQRKQVQAAFCIDVRSEVFRRALESVSAGIETIGFAGFFGFAIEYVRLGDTQGGAQCPVLITPQFVIRETVQDMPDDEVAHIIEKRTLQQRIAKAWRMFKFGAVSCFGFVGPVGLAYLQNLVMDTLGYGRPVPHPAKFGLDDHIYMKIAPTIEPGTVGDRAAGIPLAQRLDVAEGVLKAMSLIDNFARVVLLTGHGSTTVNNPYAAGLDCGACGGHSGEANARVAVQVLNDAAVRKGLAKRGIVIPDDTVFVAALHDTTTDEVTIFDANKIPATHADDIAQLKDYLTKAGQLARAERAAMLNLRSGTNIDKAVIHRSKDWSQVRPEWGLAGCAAFIVAPRERTQGINLEGRSFLHSYDWRLDEDFSVLELIMTAPMVVASWINLQYYASTVDNAFFGSGNKVLHNVVGTLGVLEGNGGDLRVGLPWQSIHDGKNYIHEPLRLNVIIQAPIEAINNIIAKHDAVRQLVDNGWLYLFASDDHGVTHQYIHNLMWTPCQ